MRAIGGALLGFVLAIVVAMLGMAATWFGLGGEFAFAGDTVLASHGWEVVQLAFTAIAWYLAGLVGARIARDQAFRATLYLCGAVLAIGGLNLFFGLAAGPEPAPLPLPPGELGFFEAGEVAVSRTWYLLVAPVVALAALVFGGRVGAAQAAGA